MYIDCQKGKNGKLFYFLRELCIIKAQANGQEYSLIPEPRPEHATLFRHAKVSLPEAVPAGPPLLADSRSL